MIRAVHIEDEPAIVVLLQNFVKKHCANMVTIVASANNINDAYLLITKEQPQLVYLDIELNQGNAFELLEKIRTSVGINFEIIFITAFSDYAIKAFKQNAIDYILKPINIDDLVQATVKAVNKIKNNFSENNILNLINQIKQDALHTKVGVPVATGLEFVYADDIIRIEANGNCTLVWLINNKKLFCNKTLKEIEAILPGHQFIRVHNTWVINKKHLRKYFPGIKSFIEMEDGAKVPVSIRKKSDLLDLFL